jgi:hypothetical protein
MGLMAERGAGRMQARQNYRTMARMQRRRSFVQSKVGVREDFRAEAGRPASGPLAALLPGLPTPMRSPATSSPGRCRTSRLQRG